MHDKSAVQLTIFAERHDALVNDVSLILTENTWHPFWAIWSPSTLARSLCNPCKSCTSLLRISKSSLRRGGCQIGRTRERSAWLAALRGRSTCRPLSLQRNCLLLVFFSSTALLVSLQHARLCSKEAHMQKVMCEQPAFKPCLLSKKETSWQRRIDALRRQHFCSLKPDESLSSSLPAGQNTLPEMRSSVCTPRLPLEWVSTKKGAEKRVGGRC